MVLLLVFMQLTRDLFAIAKFLFHQHQPCSAVQLNELCTRRFSVGIIDLDKSVHLIGGRYRLLQLHTSTNSWRSPGEYVRKIKDTSFKWLSITFRVNIRIRGYVHQQARCVAVNGFVFEIIACTEHGLTVSCYMPLMGPRYNNGSRYYNKYADRCDGMSLSVYAVISSLRKSFFLFDVKQHCHSVVSCCYCHTLRWSLAPLA